MEEQPKASLRFGILVDDLTLEAWKVETVRKLVKGGMTLALVIRNDTKPEQNGLHRKLKDYPYRKLFFQIWNHYLFKPESKKMVPLVPALSLLGLNLMEIPTLDCEPVQKGISTYLLDKDIELIKNQNLDFIIRFGFNILRGEILNVARYGVWSYHHDDEMRYRGGPPGFWEWMGDDPCNGILLQRLTESLDKGYVLKKRQYPTILHSYRAHLDQLYFDSTDMSLQVCRELLQSGVLDEHLSESKAPIYHAPNNVKMLEYWIKCVTRRCRFHLHDLFKQEDWDVGFVEAPLSRFIESPLDFETKIRWFRRKRLSEYYADPFIITTKKDTYIFFEQYDYRTGKGCIQATRLSDDFKKHHTVLTEPFHLSYPFVFEHEGVVYCLPEANESNRLILYRFDEKTMRLEQACVLMDHIKAVDPTLVYVEGRWNLFLTKKDFPSVKLYRYLADDLKGPYKPFHGNPVKADCASARMAGRFFEYNGSLIRPSQECVRYYGTAVCLNRVDKITDDQYHETLANTIEPFRRSPFKQGLHTLNGNGQFTVFDGKRWEFTLSGMFHQLGNKINKKGKRHV
ncbi:MAG: hypothetical protein IKT08_02415 [Bacteroidales bacterium]|nr:hypothetical protein [Bacteroidales bacterium]